METDPKILQQAEKNLLIASQQGANVYVSIMNVLAEANGGKSIKYQ